LILYSGYGIGGPGVRGYARFKGAARGGMARMAVSSADAEGAMPPPAPAPAAAAPMRKSERAERAAPEAEADTFVAEAKTASAAPPGGGGAKAEPAVQMRSNFAETAFFQPHLVSGADGSVSFEFDVPDSVTSWNVWVHGLTRDLSSGSLKKEARTVKELMVRPYVPRFFREGDTAELKVVVSNAGKTPMSGELVLDIADPETRKSQLGLFGVKEDKRAFTVEPGASTNVSFPLTAPRKVGTYAFEVVARSGQLSDGERRPVPLLPSRLHLAQSRFVSLRDADKRTMRFEELAKGQDPSLETEQLVVTVDAQLFYSMLNALPYLVEYPYECAEQTMNRFVSTGIITALFTKYPSLAAMGRAMAEKRSTVREKFDAPDPNRKITLEETPWLLEARGGADPGLPILKVLDPKVATAQRVDSLDRLTKMQTAIGGFPWFPGGPPSPYMTLYLMAGLSRATEFGVDVPRGMVQRGWQYLARHFREELAARMMRENCCWEILTFLNYVASSYPDPSWVNDAITAEERKQILDFSFRHWKQHAPYLKGMLALTLKRAGRLDDARLVWRSVMDSAKTEQDRGTFWAPEDRSWLWYNDTIETHAFALRVLMELEGVSADKQASAKTDGLVLWLMLNKKLNHWKSTRATAEVLYSLAAYLDRTAALGVREEAIVGVGGEKRTLSFEPERFEGRKQLVIPGKEVVPARDSTITVEKQTKGVMFASATWHFATDKLPAEAQSDFFGVTRRYFLRVNEGGQWVLKPLAEGAPLKVGDQVEVQLSLRSKHEAEYVHLRDPRAAGLEPENQVSRFAWDLGIGWYEEVRDTGSNFFFERLPVGEYTFKYRLRANMAGSFRVGPATVQSMYAPEFNAYSAGNRLEIAP
jgi:uncharacterized protein YfaS (alpha-2-macroglobulin family)